MPQWTRNSETSSDGSGFQISTDSTSITTDTHYTLSDDDFRTSAGDVVEMITRELKHSSNNFKIGASMEHNSLNAWFLDRATDRHSIDRIADRMETYGSRAAESLVLEETKADFDDAVNGIASADDYIVAFNDVTDDWPHLPRPVFANYLVQSDDYPDEFEEQARDFAEAEEVLDREMQTTLDCYYSTNPFADSSLTDDEARVIAAARMLDFDDEDVPLREIDDFDNFVWWLRESGDLDKAERLHQFGRDLPEDVLEYAAPPEEWEIPTDSLRRRSCVECGTEHTRIQHHDDGVAYVTEDGSVAPIDDLSESDRYFYRGGDGVVMVCDRCWPDFDGNSYHEAAVVTGDGTAKIRVAGQVMEDIGAVEPELMPFGELDAEAQDIAFDSAVMSIGPNDGWHVLAAGDGPTIQDRAAQRITEAVENPTEVAPLDDSDGPVVLVKKSIYDGYRRMVVAPADDWPACRYAKETLDGSREVSA